MDVSIIIPTYNEKDNVLPLTQAINFVFKQNSINGEIIFVDDSSPDGTGILLEKIKKRYGNIKVVHRSGKLGLSSAVFEGIKRAQSEVVGVMDADFSHDPKRIPALLNEIQSGADFVIGSRYIKGGKIKGWSLKRLIISRAATLLVKPFTRAKDPMSGFLMIKKKCLGGRKFNPKGFKICLELLVKSDYKDLREVPITFVDRTKGQSKASLKEALYLLDNLFGYLFYKKPKKDCNL